MSDLHSSGSSGGNGDAKGNGASNGSSNGGGKGKGPLNLGALAPLARHAHAGLGPVGLFDDASPEVDPAGEGAARAAPISLAMLRRQLKLILIVSIVFMPLLITPVWMFSTPEYGSTAMVRVEPVAFRILYQTEDQTVPMYDQYLNTQVAVVRSPKVLERALDRVKSTQWYKEKPGATLFGDAPTDLERFRGILTITPVPRTQLIQVVATTKVAKDAMAIVNAIVEEYLKLAEMSVSEGDKRRYEALSSELRACEATIKSVIADRLRSSTALGTDAPSDLRTRYMVRKHELETQLENTRLERSRCEWELSKLGDGGAASKPAASAPAAVAEKQPYWRDMEWKRLESSLKRAQLDLRVGMERYGESHWRMKELRTNLEDAERQKKEREAELDQAPIVAMPTLDADGKLRPVVRDRAFLEREIGRLQRDEVEIQKLQDSAAQKVNQANTLAAELADEDEKLKAAKDMHERLSERIGALDMEGKAPSRISIAQNGMLEKTPAKDRRLLMTAAMIAVSIGLGLGVGYVRGTADPAIHEVRDLAFSLRAPFLGQVPFVPDAAQVPQESLIGRILQESVRMVRTAMMQRLRDRSAWSVLLTSPAPGAGKTTTAILLARSLAELGKKVLLVDADLRRRSLSRWFGREQSAGLNAVLAGESSDGAAIIQPDGFNFKLLPAGKGGGEKDAQLLGNGSLSAALERWRKTYDFVLLDSPPLLSVADARILASHADGVMMVLRASHSRRSDAMEAYAGLSASGGTLLGSVLIGSAHSMHDYNRYGYYAATASHEPREDALPA